MSRPAFTTLIASLHSLASEALECGPDELHHLRDVLNTAEDTRAQLDELVNSIYATDGKEAGRECVRILKRQAQVDLSMIRSRYRFACDPAGESLRFASRTWDLAAQGVASFDPAVREKAEKTLAELRGET